MIEVERKFLLSGEQESALVVGAEFLGVKIITDIYYDHPDFRLSQREWWLRQRDGVFELKVAMEHAGLGLPADCFDEIVDEEKIRAKIGLGGAGKFLDDLSVAGFVPFAKLQTERRSYHNGEFKIDIDVTRGIDEPFEYALAEIELLVETQDEFLDAAQKIEAFAVTRGLPLDFAPGKLLKYIEEKNPAQFATMVAAGIASHSKH